MVYDEEKYAGLKEHTRVDIYRIYNKHIYGTNFKSKGVTLIKELI
jgi:hypothetical protein